MIDMNMPFYFIGGIVIITSILFCYKCGFFQRNKQNLRSEK